MASAGVVGECRPSGILANAAASAVCITSDLPKMLATRREFLFGKSPASLRITREISRLSLDSVRGKPEQAAKIGQSAPFHTPWLDRERPNLWYVFETLTEGTASGIASPFLTFVASITCGDRAPVPAMGVEMRLSSN